MSECTPIQPAINMKPNGDQTKNQLDPESMLEVLVANTINSLARGVSDSLMEKNLVENGLTLSNAQQVIQIARDQFENQKTEAQKKAGASEMFFGFLWLVGGLAITIGTYNYAEDGQKYILAWGPVVYGAYSIIKGLINSSR